jgi:uncharacterized Rossmann fold enzyme
LDWSLWEPWYIWIASALGLSVLEDYEASRVLDALIRDMAADASDLRKIVEGKLALVIGAGPSIEGDLNKVLNKADVLVAADGASSRLLELGAVPDIIVTDLDGNLNDIYEAWRKGSHVVVHAHGDNVSELKAHVQVFTNRLVGTTQVRPTGCLYNFGGFTDGDRAVFMCMELGCKAVLMVGMDFSTVVGRYSKPWLKENVVAWPLKRAKFVIAKRLLSWASRLYRRPMARLVIREDADSIDGTEDLRCEELEAWVERVRLNPPSSPAAPQSFTA